MELVNKNRIILVLSILCVLFLLGMVKSCGDSYMQKKLHDKEMGKRLDLEEKLDKINRDKANEGDKLKKELEAQKGAREQAEKALTEEQQLRQGLKEELDKANKEKQALEESLKGAQPAKK
ncbi:MAG: hypothetical protein NTU54_05385 [Candidatus Omnitrophica bacterium]|nr:hypothetical protein [Candidatus Omnitrophota bacterium]